MRRKSIIGDAEALHCIFYAEPIMDVNTSTDGPKSPLSSLFSAKPSINNSVALLNLCFYVPLPNTHPRNTFILRPKSPRHEGTASWRRSIARAVTSPDRIVRVGLLFILTSEYSKDVCKVAMSLAASCAMYQTSSAVAACPALSSREEIASSLSIWRAANRVSSALSYGPPWTQSNSMQSEMSWRKTR